MKVPQDSGRVIVVGGGVVGASIALACLRRGGRVLHIHPEGERASTASHASGAMLGAFGEVTADRTTPLDAAEERFRVESGRSYFKWLEELEAAGGSPIFRGAGTFIVANTFGRDDLRNLAAIEAAATRYGEPFEIVSEERVPGYRPNSRYLPRRVVWLPREGWLDSGALLRSIEKVMRSFDSYERLDTKCEALSCDGRRVSGVVCPGEVGVIGADHVVIAAGVGTQTLLDSLQLPLRQPRLMPGKGTAIILDAAAPYEYAIRSPNRHFACGLHIVPRDGNEIYVGATNRTAACPGTAPGASVEEMHDLLHQVVHEFNTGLDAANVIALRSGHRPISLDSYPLIGPTEISGLSVATGTYRNGILMAPAIGAAIAAQIFGSTVDAWEQLACTLTAPFAPLNRPERSIDVHSRAFIRGGAEAIVSFLPAPHGALPYARSGELSAFIEELLVLISSESPETLAQREELRGLLTRQPMHETFAQLFFLLAERSRAG